jgi:hypothetical protein
MNNALTNQNAKNTVNEIHPRWASLTVSNHVLVMLMSPAL